MLVEPLAGEMNKRQEIRLETGWSHERQLHNRYWSHKKKRVTDTGDWSHEWQQILLEPQDEEQEDNHHWGATSNRYRSHKRRQQILKTGAMKDRKYWTTTTGEDDTGAMEPQATTNKATREQQILEPRTTKPIAQYCRLEQHIQETGGAMNDKTDTGALSHCWSHRSRQRPILEPQVTTRKDTGAMCMSERQERDTGVTKDKADTGAWSNDNES